jgi:hypothetical protein
MSFRRGVSHLLAWSGVFALWLFATRQFHPRLSIALAATAILVSASALAVYLDRLWLRRRFAPRRLSWQYVASLAGVVLTLDVLAVVSIQLVYDWLWHPDPLRFGFWFNVASDGFIIALHLAAAWGVMWITSLLRGQRPPQAIED